ncbi:toprim domain-containing protein [Spirillospora sp. CA-294931]|uniref:toprim domain-containing protein n=1 Tax=Spirillospora sp. CA-294931 TaxID=3240042 RepID=UPI003D946589
MPGAQDERVLRGLAERELGRIRDGTLPWGWWLERAARYGRHGFTNTLLIAAQWRAATDVRSYAAWRAAGRQVRKGETGIRLLDPPRVVFDVAQTDGLPLEAARPNTSHIEAFAERLGLHGTLDDVVHQLAHAVRPGDRPHLPGEPSCEGLRRVETDSIAFLVLTRFGRDPGHLAFPGTAPWADAKFGDRVLRLSDRLSAPEDILSVAHRFFRSRMRESWVPAYLAGRGFAPDVQRRWGVGYAPAGPRALIEHLRARGHKDEAIIGSGLARPGNGLCDAFRDRAMFALRTPAGAVAGFIGRRPDGGDGPKYLNSPDTPAFHKGELLFGLHETGDRLARGARPVIVEGPLDAIAVNLALEDHAAMATCGLAFTPGHLAALARAVDLDETGLVLAMDGDKAGRTAAARAWRTLARLDGPVEAAVLATGGDPADILRDQGLAAVREALAVRRPLMDVVVDAAVERAGDGLGSPERRLAAGRAAARVIAAGRPAEAARQVVRVAGATGVGHTAVTDAVIEAIAHDHRT